MAGSPIAVSFSGRLDCMWYSEDIVVRVLQNGALETTVADSNGDSASENACDHFCPMRLQYGDHLSILSVFLKQILLYIYIYII